jgi:hypothetical protein
MSQFTSGKYAKAICDRCGDKMKYQALREEWTGLRVCKKCWDPKTALEFPTNFPSDAESLRDPRPDNDVEATNGTVNVANSIGTGFRLNGSTVELGQVTVSIT